ncbi:MAG: ABC transporter substrate-binding protein [Desertimonas sp.]
MQRSRARRFGAFVAGVTLVAGAAAAGTASASTDTTEASDDTAASDETMADDTEGTAAEGTATEGTGEDMGTVEAAPACSGASDGVLNFATVLPETGSLAFLGPPEFAAAQLAVNEINEAGGVLGADVTLDQGDSGDTSTDIANQTVDRQLAAGADAFIGAASSSVSFSFIDKLVENCKIHFSPANTAPDFTTYADDGLYFRTAPSDVLQGRVLADLMIADGVTNATFMALQDPYGEGLLEYSSGPFEDQGGTIIDSFTYDPNADNYGAEAERVISGDPEALVLIGFEESAQVLTALFEGGYTAADHPIYLVDGNVGNALGEQLPAGSMVGVKGTLPQAELSADFEERLLEVDPELIDYSYGPETYDSIVITALAAELAGTDDPAQVAAHINGVTRDGEVCETFADCKALIEGGATDIDYDGPAGPMTFGEAGEPTEASFAILSYDEENTVNAGIPNEYRFANI